MKRLLLIPILFLTGLVSAQIVDQFTYTGALNANGWSTHNGTAAQTVTLTTPSDNGSSLSYSGFAASSGNRTSLNEANSEDINHPITGITGVGYMSFLLKVQNLNDLIAAGDYFIGFGGPAANPLAARTFIKPGVAPNTFLLGIQNTTGGTPSQTYALSTEYPVGTTVLVVVKYDNTSSPQAASLFVNPVIGGVEPTPSAINTSGTATSFNNFATIYLRQGANTGNLEIDEIRAGSTWASVTPTGAVSCNTTNTINVSECETYTVPSNNETYVTSGTYMDTIPNAALCDSIITINLTIKQNTTATISVTECGSYTVPSTDETYMTSGTYMDTIANAAGCDSILTINLTIVGSITYYQDFDTDGFGNAAISQPGCAPIPGYVTNDDDCDDTNNAITTGSTFYEDLDGDGLGNPAVSGVYCTAPTNFVSNSNDCNDSNIAIGVAQTYYQDFDNDTYGNPAISQTVCVQPVGYVINSTDCIDNNAAAHPGATEIPNNGIDEDCNGSDLNTMGSTLGMYQFEGNDCTAPVVGVTAQPANATFGLYGKDTSLVCSQAANVFNYSNLNTTTTVNLAKYFNFTITPANCYGLDLNRIIFKHKTSGTGLTPIVHLRSSLDNFATDIATKQLPNSNLKIDTINLGAAFDNVTSAIEFRWYITEIGQTGSTYRHDDVSIIGNINAITPQTYYADTDGDGFGDPAASISDCSAPAGYVSDNTDCDDTNEEEFPGAVWYQDLDGDGLGDNAVSLTQCLQPTDYVSDNTDCNDTDDQIGSVVMYYPDVDVDGFGDADDLGTNSCTPIPGSVTNADDCDDSDNQINPSATEICDGLDNNCDGDTDEGFTMVTYYEDFDNDTYGDAASSLIDCIQPNGFVTNDDDCNDANAAIHPGAVDNTGNGVDENCDGVDGVLGIEESILAHLNVYPNPGTSSVVLNMNNGWNGFQITFAGVDGKEIALTSTQKSANELEYNTNSLVSGVYFIRLTSASGTALVRWVKN